MQALVPVLEDFLPQELVASFEEQIANLQLAYAKAVKEPVAPTAEIGVFGGSGFYSFLEDVEEVEVETPYGKPSAPFTIGEVGGRRVAFLPRHGLQPRAAAARDPVPGERLGDEGARRAADHRPQRLRRAQGRARAGRVRRLRPVRRPDERARRHVLRRARDDARLRRRPVLPRPARAPGRDGAASSASRRATAAPSSSSRARASPPAPSRSGSRTPAGTRST